MNNKSRKQLVVGVLSLSSFSALQGVTIFEEGFENFNGTFTDSVAVTNTFPDVGFAGTGAFEAAFSDWTNFDVDGPGGASPTPHLNFDNPANSRYSAPEGSYFVGLLRDIEGITRNLSSLTIGETYSVSLQVANGAIERVPNLSLIHI